jgi:hypothetical protein
MAVIEVTVRGVTPGLLMCSPQGMIDEPEDGAVKSGPRKPKPSRAQTAEGLAYRLADGTLGFPGPAFARATHEGGKGQQTKIAGRGRAIGVQTVLSGIWEVEPKDLVPLMRNGKPIKDYVIDVRTGLNQNMRPPARIVLARPLVVDLWEASFAIIWDDIHGPAAAPDLIRECMERAGRQIGVGAFRPVVQGRPTGGWFGRFDIVRWEPVSA